MKYALKHNYRILMGIPDILKQFFLQMEQGHKYARYNWPEAKRDF